MSEVQEQADPRQQAEERTRAIAEEAKADPWLLWALGLFWYEHDAHLGLSVAGPWDGDESESERLWSTGDVAAHVERHGRQRKWHVRVAGVGWNRKFPSKEEAQAFCDEHLRRRYDQIVLLGSDPGRTDAEPAQAVAS